MLTGESKVANVDQAYKLNVAEYILKPVQLTPIIEKTRKLLASGE